MAEFNGDRPIGARAQEARTKGAAECEPGREQNRDDVVGSHRLTDGMPAGSGVVLHRIV